MEDRPAYFLFVGRLEKLKGVQYLIQQFKNYKQADLLIAGTGAYEAELKALGGDDQHIEFLGKVSNDRLAALYHGAIAVLVPSLCFETFGLVALEGFAQGTPALVNNLGALPEVIQEGGGLSYSSDEEFHAALGKLQTDIDFRNKLGQEGLANLQANYTQQRHLKEYYAMIADLDYSGNRQKTT
jgi:glycosyltransferase involved in cell wall biosynthesis